jgi:hypothetical protein
VGIEKYLLSSHIQQNFNAAQKYWRKKSYKFREGKLENKLKPDLTKVETLGDNLNYPDQLCRFKFWDLGCKRVKIFLLTVTYCRC